jgi:O-antigen ligase
MHKIKFFNTKDYNSQIFLSLIFIFCISLVLSRFLSDLIVSLVSIFFLFYSIKEKKCYFLKHKLFLWIFIFWLYLIFNSLASKVPIESLKTSLPYIRFLFFIIVLNFFFKDKKFKFYLLVTFLCIYLILFFYACYQVYQNLHAPMYRVSSLFGRHLILGSFISKTFAVVIYLIFDLNLKKKYYLYFLVLIISGFLVYVSNERAATFCFIFISLFSFFYFSKKNIYMLIFPIFFFFSIIFIYPQPIKRLVFHTIEQIYDNNKFNFFSFRHQLHYLTAYNIFKSNKVIGAGVKSFRFICNKDEYSTNDYILRISTVAAPFNGYYFTTIDQEKLIENILFVEDSLYKDLHIKNYDNVETKANIINKLYLAGHFNNNNKLLFFEKNIHEGTYKTFNNTNGDYLIKGQNVYSYYPYKDGCNTHPHNFYMQALSELGIIGFAFLTSLYIFFIIGFIKCIKNRLVSTVNNQLILYAHFVIILFPVLPTGNFFNNYLSLLIYFPLAFINLWSKKR